MLPTVKKGKERGNRHLYSIGGVKEMRGRGLRPRGGKKRGKIPTKERG